MNAEFTVGELPDGLHHRVSLVQGHPSLSIQLCYMLSPQPSVAYPQIHCICGAAFL